VLTKQICFDIKKRSLHERKIIIRRGEQKCEQVLNNSPFYLNKIVGLRMHSVTRAIDFLLKTLLVD